MPYSEDFLPLKNIFLKFKSENVNNLKNKPDLALKQISSLSNQKKDTNIFMRQSLYVQLACRNVK
jgi:hypothetical protein